MSASRCFKPGMIAGWAVLLSATVMIVMRHRDVAQPAKDVLSSRTSSTVIQKSTSQNRASISAPKSIDFPAKIAEAISASDIIGLQTIVSKWFAEDPSAVRDWIRQQPSLHALEPVVIQIAKDVSSAGDPIGALQWAELIEKGPERDQTMFDIYASGKRFHSLTDEQIRAAPLPPQKIENLLSGAGDD